VHARGLPIIWRIVARRLWRHHVSFRQADQRALLDKYCVTCHSARLKTGKLVLESLDPTHPG